MRLTQGCFSFFPDLTDAKIEKHNESYLELERHGEPVIESKKVRDLLSRIKAPELQAAIQTVRANEEMTDDFQRAANFLALSIRTPAKQGQRIIGNVNVRAPNLRHSANVNCSMQQIENNHFGP